MACIQVMGARSGAGLRPFMRSHYKQVGVGHYGVFSGRRWSASIYTVVRDMIPAAS